MTSQRQCHITGAPCVVGTIRTMIITTGLTITQAQVTPRRPVWLTEPQPCHLLPCKWQPRRPPPLGTPWVLGKAPQHAPPLPKPALPEATTPLGDAAEPPGSQTGFLQANWLTVCCLDSRRSGQDYRWASPALCQSLRLT